MSINKIFLIFLLFNLSFSEEPPTAYDELVCGKKNPKKEEDCTEYGTGSGMVCCFISDVNKTNRKCRLVPDDIARGKGISGYNTFPDYSKSLPMRLATARYPHHCVRSFSLSAGNSPHAISGHFHSLQCHYRNWLPHTCS